jgi:hypothetical protein
MKLMMMSEESRSKFISGMKKKEMDYIKNTFRRKRKVKTSSSSMDVDLSNAYANNFFFDLIYEDSDDWEKGDDFEREFDKKERERVLAKEIVKERELENKRRLEKEKELKQLEDNDEGEGLSTPGLSPPISTPASSPFTTPATTPSDSVSPKRGTLTSSSSTSSVSFAPQSNPTVPLPPSIFPHPSHLHSLHIFGSLILHYIFYKVRSFFYY